jgi:hypothetical protein
VAFKAVAPAAIAPKKARLSIVSSSMLLKSCLLISSGTTASVPKLQRCCHEVQQLARKAMRSGVAPAFADTNPLSGDGGDIVLSERARHPIRVAIGRRGAALRRPSLVLGASTYARYGSAAAVVGSNKIVGLTVEPDSAIISSAPRTKRCGRS